MNKNNNNKHYLDTLHEIRDMWIKGKQVRRKEGCGLVKESTENTTI